MKPKHTVPHHDTRAIRQRPKDSRKRHTTTGDTTRECGQEEHKRAHNTTAQRANARMKQRAREEEKKLIIKKIHASMRTHHDRTQEPGAMPPRKTKPPEVQPTAAATRRQARNRRGARRRRPTGRTRGITGTRTDVLEQQAQQTLD